MSVADDFIDVMARLKSIEPDGDHPMRYAVWQCKEAAFKVIIDALQQAAVIANAARMMQRDYDDEMKARATAEKAIP